MNSYIENVILIGITILLAGLAYLFATTLLVSSSKGADYREDISTYFIPPMPQLLRIVQDYSTATTRLQVYLNREYNGNASVYVRDLRTQTVLASADIICTETSCEGSSTDTNIPASNRYIVTLCISSICVENEVSVIFEEISWPIGQIWNLWKSIKSMFLSSETHKLNKSTTSVLTTPSTEKLNREISTIQIYHSTMAPHKETNALFISSSTIDLNVW